MCAKFNRTVFNLIPKSSFKERLRGLYYSAYYNIKHFNENGFRVYYSNGHYEFKFEDGVEFKCYYNISDELKRSLPGYLAKRALRQGDIVIDCGAYIGEFTLYAAKAVGDDGKVVAFEPDPIAYNRLCDNVKLNKLTNVISVNKAVWSSNCNIKFTNDIEGGNTFFFEKDNIKTANIPVVSIDRYLCGQKIEKADFIKMDIEGAELKALKGAAQTLRDNDVFLSIASYHVINGRKTCFDVERMLKGLGYKAETLHPRHLTTCAQKGD